MNKRPKLLYTPGMISLLVVPVLFYVYQPVEKKQTVLNFVLPTEDQTLSPYLLKYSRLTVQSNLEGKKINTVYYNEDHSLNARKLEFITQEALKLKLYNDNSQVIKVRLSAETTYGEFVQLVNAMYRNKLKRYTLLGDDFYIFGEDPPEPDLEVTPLIFECTSGKYHVENMTSQEHFWEEVNKYKLLIVNNALLLSAFVLLIAVPVILIRKRGY
jgi:biopolymer transport protein ExbD